MGEKLLRLMKSEGLTSSRLAEILGTGASNISHIISGRSKPGYDLLRKILLSFPQINPDWFLLDDETMYRSDETPIREQPVSPDLFTAESATSEQPSGSPCETDIAGNTDTVDAVDPHRIASGDFRNMTSSTVQRIIIVYSDRTFESFTPKQE